MPKGGPGQGWSHTSPFMCLDPPASRSPLSLAQYWRPVCPSSLLSSLLSGAVPLAQAEGTRIEKAPRGGAEPLLFLIPELSLGLERPG